MTKMLYFVFNEAIQSAYQTIHRQTGSQTINLWTELLTYLEIWWLIFFELTIL